MKNPRVEPEKGFAKAVVQFAQLHGWRVAFFRAGRVTRHGRETYETPVGGDGKGWPDLVMVRGTRIVFAELKSATGSVRPEQEEWLAALRAVAGAEVFLWRPSDWPEIEKTLSRDVT